MHDSVSCVFVHGWAMNSAVWDDCITRLPDWINPIVVDLPGHGTMAEVDAKSLDDYVKTLVPLVHRPALWVGWSLGGLVVLRLAELYPERVAAALLVATNPCFVTRERWPCAVDEKVFDQFAQDLNQDQEKTIRRFLALQVKGLPDAMNTVRQLQKSIQSRGPASTQALVTGLNNIGLIDSPLYWLLGARDSLVPEELAQVLQTKFKQDNVQLYEKSSHAPFISQRDDFIKRLISIAENLRVTS